MGQIEIKRVTDKRGLDTFIQLHYDLYRGLMHPTCTEMK